MAMDASAKFLFLTDSAAGEVEVLSIGNTGQLTPVNQQAPCAAHTCATGPTPLNAGVHPSGKFLYTANQGSTVGGVSCVGGSVSAYSIDSSGALTPLSGSPFAAGACPSYVATDSAGSFLFVANGSPNNTTNNTISVFSIDSSGALKQTGTPFPSMVINPVALASIN
jgi:DNA-binding beta-propeller fold protein YncE